MKTIQVKCIGSTHNNLLSELWYKSDDRVTRQCTSDRQQDVHWLQVRAWHDRSYIAGIPLLAHGLTVNLAHVSVAIVVWLDELLHHVCVGIQNAARPRMIQHLFSYRPNY